MVTAMTTTTAHVHDGHDTRHHGHHHEPHESPMTMLIPLGVLALGAVFSGMLWYKVFFGEETAVRDWFGMEAAAHAEACGHGDTPQRRPTEATRVRLNPPRPKATRSEATEAHG